MRNLDRIDKCKFNEKLLEEKDAIGHQMKEWCTTVSGDVRSFYCRIYYSSLVYEKGYYAVLQQARTDEHMRNVQTKLKPN